MMPTVPSATTHSRLKRKRAPAFTEKTSSPTSTKPPIAVSMPRKISTHFFISPQRRLRIRFETATEAQRRGELRIRTAALAWRGWNTDGADATDGHGFNQ